MAWIRLLRQTGSWWPHQVVRVREDTACYLVAEGFAEDVGPEVERIETAVLGEVDTNKVRISYVMRTLE